MSDGVPLTRRRLLAGLAGAGTLGSGAGAYTTATLDDRELLPVGMTAGAAGIDVDCSAPDCEVDDGELTFAIGDLAPGTSGSRRFSLSVLDNPVRVWIRTECPPASDPLGAALEVRLRFEADCDGQGRQLFPATDAGSWGTLRELRDAFSDGPRVDDPSDPCLGSTTGPCLRLDYRLPEDATVEEGMDADLAFELYAEQCRHTPESAVRPPFEPTECEPPTCTECAYLGKLEVQGDKLEETTYEFDELEVPFASDGHDYEFDVLSVTNKDDGEETVCAEFRLLRDGQESLRMCEVRIKGGSEPPRSHPVEPPATRTPGKLCTEETEAGNSGKLRQPAISHVEVHVCADDVQAGGESR